MSEGAFRWSAAAAALAITVAAVAWMVAYPLPSYWDEAIYFNNASHDLRNLARGDALGSYWFEDRFRPPAMRVLALPFTFAFGPSMLTLRLISWAGFAVAALLLAWTVRAVAGIRAAILAAWLMIVSPVLVLSLKTFGTEYPLLIALAATLFFTFARPHCLGLGIAIGLGLLAKVSYIAVAGPLLLCTIVLIRRIRMHGAAFILGGALASTWWLRDGMSALRSAAGARGFARHSLGSPWSIETFGRWWFELSRCVTGYGAALVIVVAIVLAIRKKTWSRPVVPFVLSCAVASLPIAVMAYTGVNHNPRLLAPSFVLIIAAVAVLAAPLLESRAFAVFCAVALAAQTVAIVWPHHSAAESYIWRGATEVMSPVEQWDFSRLVGATSSAFPRVAILGEGYAFNPPQIEAGFVRSGKDALVRMIWRADGGKPFDVDRAVAFARTADLVMTVPRYRGDPSDGQPPSNAYNELFAAAFDAGRGFDGPYSVDVGVSQPARLLVWSRPGARAVPAR